MDDLREVMAEAALNAYDLEKSAWMITPIGDHQEVMTRYEPAGVARFYETPPAAQQPFERHVRAKGMAKIDVHEMCMGEAADAALAAIKQAGFVVVPAEPSEAMAEAGGAEEATGYYDTRAESCTVGWEAARDVYRAMIEASNAPTGREP